MKKLVFLFALVFGFGAIANAQTQKVTWETKATKIDDNTYKVDIMATVVDGWFIYSKDMEEGGPIPTSVTLKGDGFETKGDLAESGEGLKEFYDEVFEIDIKKYSGEVTYSQVIKVDSAAPTITANVLFMSCNDQRCLPPKRLSLPVSLEE